MPKKFEIWVLSEQRNHILVFETNDSAEALSLLAEYERKHPAWLKINGRN